MKRENETSKGNKKRKDERKQEKEKWKGNKDLNIRVYYTHVTIEIINPKKQ